MFILSLIACGKGFSVSETAPLGNIHKCFSSLPNSQGWQASRDKQYCVTLVPQGLIDISNGEKVGRIKIKISRNRSN